jgi:hypothetical protein
MASVLKRGNAFANVVALLALTVSLSGGAYAAVTINGSDIQQRSIPGNRLKLDTVTGLEIKESSLSGYSDSRRVRFEATITNGSLEKQVLKLGSLSLSFRCMGDGNWRLSGSTAASGAAGYDLNAVLTEQGRTDNQVSLDGGLLSSSPGYIFEAGNDNGHYDRAVGTLVYNSDAARETIAVQFAVYHQHTRPNATDVTNYCNLAGTATRASY